MADNYINGVTKSQLAGFIRCMFGTGNFIRSIRDIGKNRYINYIRAEALFVNGEKNAIMFEVKERIESYYNCEIIPIHGNEKNNETTE